MRLLHKGRRVGIEAATIPASTSIWLHIGTYADIHGESASRGDCPLGAADMIISHKRRKLDTRGMRPIVKMKRRATIRKSVPRFGAYRDVLTTLFCLDLDQEKQRHRKHQQYQIGEDVDPALGDAERSNVDTTLRKHGHIPCSRGRRAGKYIRLDLVSTSLAKLWETRSAILTTDIAMVNAVMRAVMIRMMLECNIQGKPLSPLPMRWHKTRILIFTDLSHVS
jgi:hypothetical protein